VSPKLARGLLAGVLGLAVLETLAGTCAYRNRLGEDDWAAAAEAIADLGNEPVFIANRWLDPLARSRLPSTARVEAVARADLRGLRRFHVLGFAGTRWSDALADDLEDLPEPQIVHSRTLHDLTLTTYTLETGEVVADLTAAPVRIETDGGPCRGSGPWKCKEGRIEARIAEVDHRPRSCLVLDLADGVEARLTFAPTPGADRLRGHVGFTDFNGRLRSDAPAAFTFEQDGRIADRLVFTDAQGWQPFAVGLPDPDAPITVGIRTAVRGRWGASGYEAHRPRPICVELRALTEDRAHEAGGPP
jgi:hypothetical protein